MADDVWHRILGTHSSCCGIYVLSAVKNPRETELGGYLSFYGNGGPDLPYNIGWRKSDFDGSKFDEAIEKTPPMPQNPGWGYRFETSRIKAGMQVLRFIALDSELPEGFTVLAENSHGKLIGRVA